jgi:hypothetical protein
MTPPRSEVFKQTYDTYLHQIRQIDFLAKANVLGLERDNDSLIIPIYNTYYRFNSSGIVTEDDKKLSVPLQVILCKYILTAPMEPKASENRWQTYREFKDAAPLVSHFTTNTNLLIENTFAGKVQALKKRCEEVGGEVQETEVYDLSFQFNALPRIPVIVNFNDSDELFPAACSILFHSSAENYLDMECLSMTGTLLSGILTDSIIL